MPDPFQPIPPPLAVTKTRLAGGGYTVEVVDSPAGRKLHTVTPKEEYLETPQGERRFDPRVVGVFAAYVAGRALGPGATYLDVFRFAGTTAFAGYGLALLQGSIWWGRKWSTTFKSMVDALIYASLTAGTMGWRWPS